MKKVLALVLVVLTFTIALAGCGGDNIIGTWTATDEGVTLELTFGEDGKGKVSTMGITADMTYTAEAGILNAKMSLMGVEEEMFKDAQFTVDGDKLSITYEGETQIFTKVEK